RGGDQPRARHETYGPTLALPRTHLAVCASGAELTMRPVAFGEPLAENGPAHGPPVHQAAPFSAAVNFTPWRKIPTFALGTKSGAVHATDKEPELLLFVDETAGLSGFQHRPILGRGRTELG